MTTKNAPTSPSPSPSPSPNKPEAVVPAKEGEDAFRKFLEEADIDDDDEKDLEKRVADYRESVPDEEPITDE